MDSFFPNFVEKFSDVRSRNAFMSENIYFCFQVFNQIIESYTSARLRYYQALHERYDDLDDMVVYAYGFDYVRHSYRCGGLKSIFCDLYNCLDKIGHLMHYYFAHEGATLGKDVYFSWLLNGEFKNVVLESGSYQLLALRSLALDFEDGYQYNRFKKIRNRITHSFLNINQGMFYDDSFSSYEITEDVLVESVGEMFLIVKAAIMYSTIAISSIKPDGPTATMQVTTEQKIFS